MARTLNVLPRNVDEAIFRGKASRVGGFNTACQQGNLLSQRWNLWSIVGGRLFCGPTSAPYHGSVDRNGQIHTYTHTCGHEPRVCGCASVHRVTWFVFPDRTSFANSMKTHIFPVPSIPLAHALNAKVTELSLPRTKEFPDLVATARKKASPGGGGRNYPAIEISR